MYTDCYYKNIDAAMTLNWNLTKWGIVNWVYVMGVLCGRMLLSHKLDVREWWSSCMMAIQVSISRMKSLARSFLAIHGGLRWMVTLQIKWNHATNLNWHAMLHSQLPYILDHPWVCIHIVYAGPYFGKWFLIVVDAHSKWLEVNVINSATTTSS